MDYCEQARRERGVASREEERRRRGSGVALGKSPGILLGLHSQAGGGARGWPGTATQVLRLTQRRRQRSFANSPLALQIFPRILKQLKFVIFYESTCSRIYGNLQGFPVK
jgi:hypothetical protein